MESQAFQYWLAQGNFIASQPQSMMFEMSPELSKVPSLSGSPLLPTFDQFPAPSLPANYFPQIVDEQLHFGSQQPMPMSPSDFGSDDNSPHCSPPQARHAEPVFAPIDTSVPTERKHATSGRRRAQNRAAQRAFRERKEKYARDLEDQLSVMNDKYNKLEASHMELNTAFEKLRRTMDLLTSPSNDDDIETKDNKDVDFASRRPSGNSETLRKLLEILHGEFKGVTMVKTESD